MTLDITVERAELRLNSETPDRQTSYVKLKAGGRQCHTVIGHGANPYWSRQIFRSAPQSKFLLQVCFPAGAVQQPHADRVFARGVFDFGLFASKSQLQQMDDTSEVEVKLPLESVEERGRDAGTLYLKVKYIIGKMHIGGLHPFAQMDLTFDDMASRTNQGSRIQSQSSQNNPSYGTPSSPSMQEKRSAPSKLNPFHVSQFKVGNSNIYSNINEYQNYPAPVSIIYRTQPSKYTGANIPHVEQVNVTTSVVKENPVAKQQITETISISKGSSLSNMKEPWTLTKSYTDKLNIFSVLDEKGKPFELAPPKIFKNLSKSNMRQ